MTLQDRVLKAKELKAKYERLYGEDDFKNGAKIEKDYLIIRKEIIDEVDEGIHKLKSIPLALVRKKVASTPRPIPIETGITPLDRELVTPKEYGRGKTGGFPLGNLIQLSGVSYAGKTSLFLKMLSNFSAGQKVSWFNFEMSDRQVIDAMDQFKTKEENVLYYSFSRDLDDIIEEIKYLSADGVKHFFIDSNMNVTVKGANQYETDTAISAQLKEVVSNLDVNVYLINQVSQQTEREGGLHLKGGNNATYFSDLILFIIRPKVADENGKPKLDETNNFVYDDNRRFIKCTKNRIFDRLFLVEITKQDLFGVEVVREVEYQDIDMLNI